MNRGVVVTGASSGIGLATARLLASRGLRVFGGYRRSDGAEAVAGAGAIPVRLDVTDAGSVRSAREAVTVQLGEDAGALIGLVNNAGIPGAGPLELVPLEEFRRVLEVNVVGAVATTQAFLPLLRRSRGRVVMMSSVSGRIPMPFAGPYAASKFALEGLSDSLRRELKPLGVDVVVVQPGAIRTPIWRRVEEMDLSRYEATPYGRVMERVKEAALSSGRGGLPPERVAEAVWRALTARRPPSRILVVRRAGKWRLRVLQRLPDRWLDAVIARRAWR